MKPEDEYTVRIVTEELQYLREAWDESISDASLRRESSILRLLLVENKISQAWRLLGYQKEPTVKTFTLDDTLKDATSGGVPIESITYAQVGGARCNGGIVGPIVHYDIALSDEEMRKRTQPRQPIESGLTISQYMRLPWLRVNLKRCSDPDLNGIYAVSRTELVKYVANKLGGAHLDVKRSKSNVEERKYIVMDMLSREIRVMDKPAIYYELLAIGQALAKSDDTMRILERARQLGIA